MSQTAYEVEEEDGAVTVCVDISGATLARAVIVTVSTEGMSAIGILINRPADIVEFAKILRSHIYT